MSMEKNIYKIKLFFQNKGFNYKDRLGNGGYGDIYIYSKIIKEIMQLKFKCLLTKKKKKK